MSAGNRTLNGGLSVIQELALASPAESCSKGLALGICKEPPPYASPQAKGWRVLGARLGAGAAGASKRATWHGNAYATGMKSTLPPAGPQPPGVARRSRPVGAAPTVEAGVATALDRHQGRNTRATDRRSWWHHQNSPSEKRRGEKRQSSDSGAADGWPVPRPPPHDASRPVHPRHFGTG